MAQLQYVSGLEGILDTLKALPPEIVSKRGGPVRVALRKAAIVVQNEAKDNVQRIIDAPNVGGRRESSGNLKKAIIVSRKKPRGGLKGEFYALRVRRGAKNPRGVTANKYGGILEFGYEGVSAKPWLRTAFETKKQEALDTFVSEMKRGLGNAVKRARRLARKT
jgi:HK97 gp10 family phage protein